ncbi:hypothetical protein FLM06_02570 [Vibrio cholerae]|uniref:hypothetical protein n=2 Tax=Vibrio cholerae TaxID=666 RepID=UPI00115A8FE7|nr:hypothetical protein [Vibrio cholerae]TQO85994.1 hypothetical protein FLM06_02570 [Vibrio cholerae]TQP07618.1 hypothetical protein FLM03_19220 [Vibrio cholerae]TQP43230.1 hypothetical protein FLL99_15870 [Vibrio cholerae]TQP67045.1 hypothetical protein FLL91_16085 [Vibrio cholerae]TQP78063.1 hypothetical protein FLL75_05320 [Vibrio cholerae]
MRIKRCLLPLLFFGNISLSSALTIDDYVPSTSSLSLAIHKISKELIDSKKINLSNRILIVDLQNVKDDAYDVELFKTYDSLLLIGNNESVGYTMEKLFGFSVDSDTLLIDNINGPGEIKVKRYAPNEEIPDEIKAIGLLKML